MTRVHEQPRCEAKPLHRSSRSRTSAASALFVGLLLLVEPRSSYALLVSLEDPAPPNALAQIETRTMRPNPSGLFRWEADGIPHMNRQSFWYRLGLPMERNVGDLGHSPSPPINDTNANSYDDELDVTYVDPDGVEIRIVTRLRGDGPFTRASTVTETITVRNTGPSPRPVFFYQYSDLDLEAGPGDDEVEITGASGEFVTQRDPGFVFTQSISGLLPTQFEIDVIDGANDLVPRLDDSTSTVLTNVPGPLSGNVSYAYRWDFTLDPAGSPGDTTSFQIVKRVEPRPAPPVPVGGTPLWIWMILACGGTAAALTRRPAPRGEMRK